MAIAAAAVRAALRTAAANAIHVGVEAGSVHVIGPESSAPASAGSTGSGGAGHSLAARLSVSMSKPGNVVSQLIAQNKPRGEFRNSVYSYLLSQSADNKVVLSAAAESLTDMYSTFQQFRELLTVTSSFSQAINLDECIHHIITHVSQICSATHVFCYLVNAHHASLRLSWVYDGSEDGTGFQAAVSTSSVGVVDAGLAGVCATTGEVQLVNHFDESKHNGTGLFSAAPAAASEQSPASGSRTVLLPAPALIAAANIGSGIRIRNVLCVPVRDHSGTIVAIIQAMNKTQIVPPGSAAALAAAASAAPASKRIDSISESGPPPAPPVVRVSTDFTDQDSAILSFIALIAGQTIQNARLHDDTLRMKKEQQVLFQVLKATENVAEVESVIEILIDGCYEILECERIGLYFVDWVTRDLYMVRSSDAQGFCIPLTKGLSGAVAMSGKGLKVDDAYMDKRFDPTFDKITGNRTRSVLTWPVFDPLTGKTLAVLQAVNKIARIHDWRQTPINKGGNKPSAPGSGLGLGLSSPSDIHALSGSHLSGMSAVGSSRRASMHTFSAGDLKSGTGGANAGQRAMPNGPALTRHGSNIADGTGGAGGTVDPTSDAASAAPQFMSRGARKQRVDALRNDANVIMGVPFTDQDEMVIAAFCMELSGILRKYSTSLVLERLEHDNPNDSEADPMAGERASSLLESYGMATPQKRIKSKNIATAAAAAATASANAANNAAAAANANAAAATASPSPNAAAVSATLLAAANSTPNSTDASLAPMRGTRSRRAGSITTTASALAAANNSAAAALALAASTAMGLSSPAAPAANATTTPATPTVPPASPAPTTTPVVANGTPAAAGTTVAVATTPALPKCDVKVELAPWPSLTGFDRGAAFANMNTLDCNVFDYTEEQVCIMAEMAFTDLGLLRTYPIAGQTLQQFLVQQRLHYRRNRYHNFYHGFSVFLMNYWVLKHTNAREQMTDLDVLAMMVASISHDLDHPGVNNAFEVATGSAFALAYNDTSVLENHHIATLYDILRRPECNLFESLPVASVRNLRTIIIKAIISTDMAFHADHCKELDYFTFNKKRFNPSDAKERQFLVNTLVHGADIMHGIVYNVDIAKVWAERISDEFGAQVNLEGKLGLPQTEFMKNLHIPRNVGANQRYFCASVCMPMLKSMALCMPQLKTMIRNVGRAHDYFDSLVPKEQVCWMQQLQDYVGVERDYAND